MFLLVYAINAEKMANNCGNNNEVFLMNALDSSTENKLKKKKKKSVFGNLDWDW